jgi:PIN domain nuclease of toxin-antitoxin system
LPISLPHIWRLAKPPDHHKDPFDRLLISQAATEGLT